MNIHYRGSTQKAKKAKIGIQRILMNPQHHIYTCQEYVTCINKERMFQMQYCNGLAACS